MPAPSNNTAPALSGTQEVGYTLTCSQGSWSGGVDSYAYQWQEQLPGGHPYEDVAGATSNTYTIIANDQAHIIRCKVTATNQVGSTIAYSDATAEIPNDILIVEDGTAKDDSNTYVHLDYADSYFAIRDNTDWFTYNVGQRKAALIRGCIYLDQFQYVGQKKTYAQALQWPRINVRVDGFDVPSDEIPKNLKYAQCEAALRALAGDLGVDIDPGNITEETVDVITVTYSDYSNGGQKRFPTIERFLSKLTMSSGGSYRRVVRT